MGEREFTMIYEPEKRRDGKTYYTFYFPGRFKLEYSSDGLLRLFNNPNDLENMTLQLIEDRKKYHSANERNARFNFGKGRMEAILEFFSRNDINLEKEKDTMGDYLRSLFEFVERARKGEQSG